MFQQISFRGVKWLTECFTTHRGRDRLLLANRVRFFFNTSVPVSQTSIKAQRFSCHHSVHRRYSFVSEVELSGKVKNSLLAVQHLRMKNQFIGFYPELMEKLKSSSILGQLPALQEWIEKLVDYNISGGKLNRGLALVESFSILEGHKVSEERMKAAIALGWAVELLQAFFLVADDIMDKSHTRRNKPCWYRTNNLGVKAFNDSILLESIVYQVVSSYCRDQPYYLSVLELFHDITLKTSLGQAMDLHTAPDDNEKPDLDKFTLATYDAIVKYKTAYYSFYLPVAIAMRMSGIKEEEIFKHAEDILLPMGRFFQIQDDYLDCFGDPEVTGKIGTDIEDGKCTWLIVNVLPLCDPDQRLLIQEHYGSKEAESVRLIKDIYEKFEVPKLYARYEEESYRQLSELIRSVEHQLPTSVFQGFMDKIYRRSN